MARTKIRQFKNLLKKHRKVGLDTMVFIYQFANHPEYSVFTQYVFQLLEEKKLIGITSVISLIETLVRPERENKQNVISEYETVFQHYPNLTVLPIDWYVARLASKLRAIHPMIRVPDAVQLSAAIIENCSLFITNDFKLKKVKGIEVVALKDYID